MITLSDEQQRLQALNPAKSFIVQAPAGSGKTELLTQRFLVLLSIVKQPEEILAITFTKKSAAEMRARIIHALQNALSHTEPETPHAKKTWNLAKKALAQDQLYQWNILMNPSRLRIQTIDSLNSSLTKQLPILSHFGAPADITDDALPLYQQAVRELLAHLEEDHAWSQTIATILLHMDNDLNKVEALLVNLLSKRDQWLRHINPNINNSALRDELENQLELVVTDILNKLTDVFPDEKCEELLFLIRYAANNVPPDSPLAACSDLSDLPGTHIADKKYWLALRELLFTQSDEWRKRFDKQIGFPPATDFKNKQEKETAADIKKRASAFIYESSQDEALKNAFKELKNAPDTVYQETQWQALEALHHVLQLATAHLKLVFQQQGKIDYIENALAALDALGTDENPTDLTLTLDYQIKHILVDEFQDTSNSQYLLLKKMTTGWEPHDGRTLFLVGDPMQSIYRFREAEVGIFIRAREYGIAHLPLESLTLTDNFRSTPTIVNWINTHFPDVLSAFDDIATGAVSYCPSHSNQNTEDEASSITFFNGNENEEANAIVQLIQQKKLQNPLETIAILVRSRTHLTKIIPALNAASLTYRAIDIDPLTNRPFIQDLMALTRALLHPADRIAWLAILRAPWCGLSLSDLLILSGRNPKISLWENMQSQEVLASLSAHGKLQLERIVPILKIKLFERRRHSLRAWIESTWILLGGPACLEQKNDLENAESYFKLLATLDRGGDLPNLDMLDTYVSRLYAAALSEADQSLQIMTIHNAKGLEFDTVILPHLERKTTHDDKQLMLWMEKPRIDENTALILAPVHAVGQETDSIYEYIKKQNALKNDYERGRLLYVAATRAKKQLALFFNVPQETVPTSSSLLYKLWPSIKNQISFDQVKDEPMLETAYQPHWIKRLSTQWKNPVKEVQRVSHAFHNKKSGFMLADPNPKYAGILIHQILQQISRFGATWWTSCAEKQKTLYLKNHLLQLGVVHADLDNIINHVHLAINKTLNDPRGQWILSSHQHAESEFRLTACIDLQIQHLIIDRTFVDENNIRWIIDYKTSTTEQENQNEFLLSEQQKYQKQLWQYAEAMRAMEHRSIRVGLYFPLLSAWHEWDSNIPVTAN